MAFKSKYPLMEWSAIEAYMSENIAYKDEARDLITQQLGFAPNLQASRSIEIGMRHSLRLLEEGKITQNRFNRETHNCVKMVQRNIIKYVPEQAHLVNTYKTSQSFIRV